MMCQELLIDIGILSEVWESGNVSFFDVDMDQQLVIFGGDALTNRNIWLIARWLEHERCDAKTEDHVKTTQDAVGMFFRFSQWFGEQLDDIMFLHQSIVSCQCLHSRASNNWHSLNVQFATEKVTRVKQRTMLTLVAGSVVNISTSAVSIHCLHVAVELMANLMKIWRL
jgi:hypothetical protein